LFIRFLSSFCRLTTARPALSASLAAPAVSFLFAFFFVSFASVGLWQQPPPVFCAFASREANGGSITAMPDAMHLSKGDSTPSSSCRAGCAFISRALAAFSTVSLSTVFHCFSLFSFVNQRQPLPPRDID
jgi:hypothetical protein